MKENELSHTIAKGAKNYRFGRVCEQKPSACEGKGALTHPHFKWEFDLGDYFPSQAEGILSRGPFSFTGRGNLIQGAIFPHRQREFDPGDNFPSQAEGI